ncbi:hypothetical protein HZS_337, partial [Henneguya salminicola]
MLTILFLLHVTLFYDGIFSKLKVIGATFYDSKDTKILNGILHISTKYKRLILYGFDVESAVSAAFTHISAEYDTDCAHLMLPVIYSATANKSRSLINLEYVDDSVVPKNRNLYVCIGVEIGGKAVFTHQGNTVSVIIDDPHKFMPFWLSIGLIAILIVLSGMFSGLNLGLMSLTPRELNLIIKTGTPNERHNARAVLPLRKMGNVLLCAILFGNTIVNSTTAIILEDLTSGLLSVTITTLTIVIFGEVIPQSICARYGLLIGAKTRYFTWLIIVLTFPICYPLGKLLDVVIGCETPIVYNRHQLLEVVKLNCEGNLEADE